MYDDDFGFTQGDESMFDEATDNQEQPEPVLLGHVDGEPIFAAGDGWDDERANFINDPDTRKSLKVCGFRDVESQFAAYCKHHRTLPSASHDITVDSREENLAKVKALKDCGFDVSDTNRMVSLFKRFHKPYQDGRTGEWE